MEEKTTKNYNVLLLSIAFMLIFTGFNTMAGVQVYQSSLNYKDCYTSILQTLVFRSATTPGSGGYVDGFHGDGYICAAVNYAVFAGVSWLGPSVVAIKGWILLQE